jgi:hypothetical protein
MKTSGIPFNSTPVQRLAIVQTIKLLLASHFEREFAYELGPERSLRMEFYNFSHVRQETGANNVDVRLAEADGTISPRRTSNGWRIFTQAEIDALRGWLSEHRKPQEQRA